MPSEVEQLRDLARAFWSGRPVMCPKHTSLAMTGSFVQTTFSDHVFLTCPRGETFTIPQRPKQIEFQPQQVEGYLENIQRGDANLCYRCQSVMEMDTNDNATTFTCVRCFSFGTWAGNLTVAGVLK
jgi:hypothetical protein